jgi:hypothetical protein
MITSRCLKLLMVEYMAQRQAIVVNKKKWLTSKYKHMPELLSLKIYSLDGNIRAMDEQIKQLDTVEISDTQASHPDQIKKDANVLNMLLKDEQLELAHRIAVLECENMELREYNRRLKSFNNFLEGKLPE